MRTLWIWISVLALAAPALAQGTEEEEAIDKLTQGWAEAWNQGNAKAIAELYATDADLIGASGEAAKGQAAIEEILAGFLSGPYKGAQLTVETTSIRFIKPHLAVSDSRWEVSDVPEAEGEQPPTKGLSTTVLVKEDDQWKLAAHRSRVPFSPPSREQ